MMHSTASKHIEQLELYNEYKVFLDNLYRNKPGAETSEDGNSPMFRPQLKGRPSQNNEDEMLDLQIPP